MTLEIKIEQQDEFRGRARAIGTVILKGTIRHGRSMRTIPYLEGAELPFNEPIDGQLWREKIRPRRRMYSIHIIEE